MLRGSTVDTNSAYISRRLADLDVDVIALMTVGDDPGSIKWAIAAARAEADIVIITGGLGPTDDDNTVQALANLYHRPVETDSRALQRMRSWFEGSGRTVSEHDLKMVEVISGAAVLENIQGLAPGMAIDEGGTLVMALPGVPAEMREIFESQVRPCIIERCHAGKRSSVSAIIVGMKESDVNRAIQNSTLPDRTLSWGITAASGLVTVTVIMNSSSACSPRDAQQELQSIFGDSMIAPGCTSPQEELLALLEQAHKTLAVAESCTGGLISKRLTDIPGSSKIFKGSVVAYSNQSKTEQLDVRDAIIADHGAVSEETARAMALGARKRCHADIAVATTGIAGPGGGTPSKPAGTVCFAYALEGSCESETKFFSGTREMVRSRAALHALDRMRRTLRNRIPQ